MTRQFIVSDERFSGSIRIIRDQATILDEDLAGLYGVEVRILVRNVKRNPDRFPEDFAFQLTAVEWATLRSQIGISKGRGGRRFAPHAFTEHGALMAASVLNSPAAVQVGLQVVRAFVRIRKVLATHVGLARRVANLERLAGVHEVELRRLSDTFRTGVDVPPEPTRRPRIGFEAERGDAPRKVGTPSEAETAISRVASPSRSPAASVFPETTTLHE